MNDLILRRAAPSDMNGLLQLQLDVFSGEQGIPSSMNPLPAESSPQWWCAFFGSELVGGVGAWRDHEEVHWGRYTIKPNYRGQHIGTKLARFSFEDLFSQGVKEIHMEAREITVRIICSLGGKITGEPKNFYLGTITPVVLYQTDYIKAD